MKKFTVIAVIIVLAIVAFSVSRAVQKSRLAAQESAQRALLVEARTLLEDHYASHGKYPSQLESLPFTYPDGGDVTLLKDMKYSTTGSGYTLKAVGYSSNQVLIVEIEKINRPNKVINLTGGSSRLWCVFP